MKATGNMTLLLAVAPSFKWPRVRTRIPGTAPKAVQSKKRYVCLGCIVKRGIELCGYVGIIYTLSSEDFIEVFYKEPAWVREAEKQAKRKHRHPSKARPDGWFTDPAPGKKPHVYRRQFGSACGKIPWNAKMKKGKLGREGCKLCARWLAGLVVLRKIYS